MCGIAGIIELGGIANEQLTNAVSMAHAMRHRGPDDEGFVIFTSDASAFSFFGSDTPEAVRDCHRDAGPLGFLAHTESLVAFAHRRLSIIDISPAGHQPMRSHTGQYWIVFNGEIYNYLELKEELRALGHKFVTDSDTEVILCAYSQWGADCVKKFNGDWAILIYDTQRREVFISRDRFGIKPLYFYQDNSCIIFSSEIKGLLANPRVKTAPNIDHLKDYVLFGAKEWLAETSFVNIKRFPLAHSALIRLEQEPGRWTAERYWSLDPDASIEVFETSRAKYYAEQYYALLKDAIRIRLRSDVPVGCALSGGLDSSSIVYLADQILIEQGKKETLKSFSTVHLSSSTKHCDESYFIDLLQNQLGFQSFKIEPDSDDIPRLSEIVQMYWENPPDGTGMAGISTYRLAREIGLKVTLDGQGADEQQAGYEYYIITYLGNLPLARFIPELLAINKNLSGSEYRTKIVLAAVVKRFLGAAMLSKVARLGRTKLSFASKSLNHQLKQSTFTGLVNLIHYSDSRSMYYSIESRMPFMDHRLVEFTAQIPECYKIHNGFQKYIARLAFDKKLPDEITWRKDKMGWPMPEQQWFDGPLGAWVDGKVESSPVIREMSVLQELKTHNLAKRIRLLNTAVWGEVFWGNYKCK